MIPIRILFAHERHRYAEHLCSLDAEARRLRFARAINAQGICDSVTGLGGTRHAILVHEDDTLAIAGAVLVTCRDRALAEMAFSVDRAWRGQGLATELAHRAMVWARNRDIAQVGIYCLAENVSMRRLAQHIGVRLQIEGPDCEGTLELPRRTPFSLMEEMIGEGTGLLDHFAKRNRLLNSLPPSCRRAA
ncbi:MAG: GNAT family N-acetyltransferase [Defluviicoccus sp.]